MEITVQLPDDLAEQMIPHGNDPSRIALEDMAVEAYRAKRLTEHQLAELLGFGRYDLDGFLKQRKVWIDYSEEELAAELATGDRLSALPLDRAVS